MGTSNMLFKLAVGACLPTLVLGSAQAVTITPSSVTLVNGAKQSIELSNVVGKSITVSNSAPKVASISKVEPNKYRINGVSAGTTTIRFKDSKNTATLTVVVTATTATALNGRLLASNCFQCHGTNGMGGFDKLAGQSANELYSELKKFSTGEEDPDGLMSAHAKGFSDAQIRAIANYLATVR